mgnify:CR=1 FL=1
MVMITPPSPEGESAAPAARTGDSSPRVIVGGGKLAHDFDDAAALLSDTIDDTPKMPSSTQPREAAKQKTAKPAGEEENKEAPPTARQEKQTNQREANSESSPEDGKKQPAQVDASSRSKPKELSKNKRDKQAASVAAAAAATATQQAANAKPTAAEATPAPPPIEPPTESMSSIELDPRAAEASTSALAQAGGALSDAERPTTSGVPQAGAPSAVSGAAMPPPAPPQQWATPTQLLWQRYGLIGAASLAAIVVVGGLLAFLLRGNDPKDVAETENPAPPVQPIVDPEAIPDNEANDGEAGDGSESEANDGSSSVSPPPEVGPADGEDSDANPEEPPPATDIDTEPPEEDPSTDPPGDAPPLFAGDEPTERPLEEPTADTGLGDLAPLIDAFHVPPAPARNPIDEDGPSETPVPVPTATASRPRPDPVRVNVDARLSDTIAGIDTSGAPLAKVLELVTQISTIPITISPEALTQMKLRPDTPVDVVLAETTIEGVLKAVLGKALAYETIDDQIVIVSAPSRGEWRKVTHDVGDLVRGANEARELATTIRALIAPDSWDTAGGEGILVASETSLIATNSFDVQFRVHSFLQKLRVARTQPIRSKFDAKLFATTSKTQRAQPKLKTSVRAVYHVEKPLTKILAHLEKAADVNILVDWQALGEVGWPPHSNAAVVADGVPLSKALDELLGPMDLTWRALDENTLQVTSVQALTSQAELEVYPVGKVLAAEGIPALRLIDGLQKELGPGLFVAAGGPYEIRFDAPSKSLLVRLPQAQQRVIEGILEARAATSAE